MSYPFNPANLWTTSRYMQQSTYSHDFTQLGISPRQRPGDHVHNASMRADIPAGTYRPTMYDQLESPRRERIPKRGTEWIGGRRYDNEPREGRHDMYERQRRIDMSPERYDRGRNGSPERLDRGRNGSPERERRFDQFREPNDRYDRYDYPREPVRDKYDERYEKPRDPILDGYANHKMADRTTQKDYGEFMLEKIKQDELRRNLDFPKQDIPAAQSGGVYLFIRTDKGALTEIRKALQEGRSVLANSGGQLKGIAHSDQIKLLEGHHGWNIRYPVTRRGEYWMERTDSNPAINNIIIVLEFSDVSHADLWLMTSKFKSMQFPEPYGFESFIVPINYNPTYAGYTFLLTEYPEAFIELVRDKYLPRLRTLLGRFYKYDDQLTIQFLSRGLPREEMQKSRGNWINRRSSIIGIRFRNEYDAMDFWRDTEFRSIREEIKQLVDRDPYQPPDKWFHPISVVFTLNEVRV